MTRLPNIHRLFLPAAGLLVISSLYLHAQPFPYSHARVVTENGSVIRVEVADTPEKRRLGLARRDYLRAGWGMLFIFESRVPHRFWMKDMRFPIDIIWLDNHRIIDLALNVNPPEKGKSPPVYIPRAPANFVLELSAGQASELGLVLGQQLRYQF